MIVHIECLISREVRDASGTPVGRLEGVHGHEEGAELVIDAYTLSRGGFLAYVMRELGFRGRGMLHVPWEKLDLRGPRPRLTCTVDELTSTRQRS